MVLPAKTAAVIIGRNEGERLLRCLASVVGTVDRTIYVDSGSTDGSVAFAQSLGMHVVQLDMSIPFTAARARNAGFASLLEQHPQLRYVQFLDGDCELQPGWIEAALGALEASPTTAIVSGRRSERFPDASIYNKLMDIEWNTPVGETNAVLGDLCIKVDVFKQVGGFSNHIIAAEDDDLCLRVRALGYKVFRVDARMTVHDANIMRLSQWLKRAQRAGHGFAQINLLHGQGPEKHFRKQLISAALWGGAAPAMMLTPPLTLPVAMLLSGMVSRTILRRLKQGDEPEVAVAYGLLMFSSKVPEFIGALQFHKNRLLSRDHQLIEYK